MIRWKKENIIFKYSPELKNTISHCQQPTPFFINEKIVRIFFGSRNELNYSQIYFFDFDIERQVVTQHSKDPIICAEKGFDSHGVYPACVLNVDSNLYMYYVGFNKIGSIYTTNIGLALSRQDDCKFVKHFLNPILSIGNHDPCLVTSPCVIKEDNIWRMWYVSGYRWDEDANGSSQSYYHVKYAESEDGVHWKREGLISVEHTHPGETNIGRLSILKEDGIYKAWYPYACGKLGYRIGYAESTDGGFTFKRMDHLAGITVSNEPWENEAVAYPAVVVHNGKKYMFYNGNRFGKDGIALAVEE